VSTDTPRRTAASAGEYVPGVGMCRTLTSRRPFAGLELPRDRERGCVRPTPRTGAA